MAMLYQQQLHTTATRYFTSRMVVREREREPGGGLLTCERFSLACARFVSVRSTPVRAGGRVVVQLPIVKYFLFAATAVA